MPCWDSYLYAKEAKENKCTVHQEERSTYQEEYSDTKNLKSKIHNLTEMLCGLCQKAELEFPSVFTENAELSVWWEDHKANDEIIKGLEEVRSLKKQLNDIEQLILNSLTK